MTRRLTPDKIRGYAMPKLPRINKGNTSIIYQTADPCVLEVFTVEVVKMDWWSGYLWGGLGILLDGYEDVAEAVYTGYEGLSAYAAHPYKTYTLTVYRALVKRLQMPDKEQMRRIRQIQRAINNVRYPYNASPSVANCERWQALSALEIPEIAEAVDFALNYDPYAIYPDFGAGDFMVQDGEIVALDPFHHEDVNKALRLRDYAGSQY